MISRRSRLKKSIGRRITEGPTLPRWSEYPNSRVLGPKIHTLNGFWTLKPYYLGTWTLWVNNPYTSVLEVPLSVKGLKNSSKDTPSTSTCIQRHCCCESRPCVICSCSDRTTRFRELRSARAVVLNLVVSAAMMIIISSL